MSKLLEPNNIPASPLTYDEFLDSAEKHLLDTINESGAILYLLTVTFAQTMNVNQNQSLSMAPRSGRSVLKSFEKLYANLMNSKKLPGNNYDRKDRMKPFTYAFLDFSSTIGSQLKPARGQFDKLMVDDRVPEWNPHIHAIMAIHPHTLDNIEALGSKGLEIFFKRFISDVATVDLQRIDVIYERVAIDKKSGNSRIITADKPLDPAREYLKRKGALPYASKALKLERDDHGRSDLWTVLPDSEFRLPDRTERLIKHLHSWNA